MAGKLRFRALLNGTAVAAMIWAIVRASVQAITIDEAVSYLNFARGTESSPSYWEARDNNHVLNSILMRFFTGIFGPSPVTVRAGALIGAAIYLWAARRMAVLIARETGLRWSLFVCLVFNPFVFDFLVAARGYGLALAFLLSAIAIIAGALRPDAEGSLAGACFRSSVCGGLCVAANFSFSFAAAATLLALYVWAGMQTRPDARTGLRLAATCVLPGAVVLSALAGSALVHWRELGLTHGAQTLRDTLRSVAEASLYEPNGYLVNPVWSPLVGGIFAWIWPVLGLGIALRFAAVVRDVARSRDPHTRWLVGLGASTMGALGLSLSVHALAHALFGMRYPLDRTAIFIVPLATLAGGIIVAVPVRPGWLRRIVLGMPGIVAGCYLVCMRMTYFREWKWDLDIDRVYGVLTYYNHTCGVKQVSANWRYDAALNYYNAASRRETFAEIPSTREYPTGSGAYVLYGPEDGAFVAGHHLKVVYEGQAGALVALAPEKACEEVLPKGRVVW